MYTMKKNALQLLYLYAYKGWWSDMLPKFSLGLFKRICTNKVHQLDSSATFHIFQFDIFTNKLL